MDVQSYCHSISYLTDAAEAVDHEKSSWPSLFSILSLVVEDKTSQPKVWSATFSDPLCAPKGTLAPSA